MAHHKKLSDELLANDYVIHQNACADRKLQQELDHLDKQQATQRRRLTQAAHYFTVMHSVVPVFEPLDEVPSKRRSGGKSRTRPTLNKRHTESALYLHDQESDVNKSRSDTLLSQNLSLGSENGLVDLRDIAVDPPRFRANEMLGKGSWERNPCSHYRKYTNGADRCFDHSVVNTKLRQEPHLRQDLLRADKSSKTFRQITGQGDKTRHAWSNSIEKHGDFILEGKTRELSKRAPISSRDSNNSLDTSRMTKRPGNFENNNGCTYSKGNSYLQNNSENGYRSLKGNSRGSSIDSNRSEGDSESGDDELLPSILSEKVGLRVSSTTDASQEIKMLYQLRDGQLEVPKTNGSRTENVRSENVTFSRNGVITTIDKLSLNKRKLQKSKSLDTNAMMSRMGRNFSPLGNSPICGANVTLVKFLPKSKQAFYLREGTESSIASSRKLSASWHGCDNLNT